MSETTQTIATATTTPEIHERTRELLPWLLNGTLEDADRQAVEEHLAGCAECREELIATRDAFDVYTAHLPADVVMAYAEDGQAEAYPVAAEGGETRVMERRLVERHLEQCAACREEVEMTRESLGALGDEAAPATAGAVGAVPLGRRDPEGDEPWRAAPAGAALVGDSAFSPAGAPRWLPFAMAASLLLAVVAGGGWFIESQRLEDNRDTIAELNRDLESARAELAAAQAAGGGEGTADLVAYEERLAGLQAEMERLTGSLESEQSRVAELRDELSRAGGSGPVMQANPDYAAFVLGTTRGGAEEPGQAELAQDRPLVISIADGGSGFVREGTSLTYRVLDTAGEPVAEEPVTPRRDAQGYLDLWVILYPGQLPPGPLTLQILDGDQELGRFPLTRP